MYDGKSGRQVKQYLVTLTTGSKKWVTDSMIPPSRLLYEYDREKLGLQRFAEAVEDDSTLTNPAEGDGSALDLIPAPSPRVVITPVATDQDQPAQTIAPPASSLTKLLDGDIVPQLHDNEGHELFIVQTLIRRRFKKRHSEWLVQWYGESDGDATWEPERNIKHVAHWSQLVCDFQQAQANRTTARVETG